MRERERERERKRKREREREEEREKERDSKHGACTDWKLGNKSQNERKREILGKRAEKIRINHLEPAFIPKEGKTNGKSRGLKIFPANCFIIFLYVEVLTIREPYSVG